LEYLFERHAASKENFVESTRENYRQCYKNLGKFFVNRSPSSLTIDDGERFRTWCVRESGLSESTVSRYLRACKSIFKFGADNGYLLRNPFENIRRGNELNVSRMHYVDRSLFCQVLSCCRNDRERLILALARYGGFRVPSEIRNLRFRDFADGVIRIDSATKTGSRDVPFFEEIREIFVRLQGDPDELVFPKVSRGFPREILKCAIMSAGVERWPKLFINLRSSCITDFVTIGYTEKALDSMFGNSARIGELHYVQFRKESEYRRMLEDNRCLADYLRYRIDSDIVTILEPSDLREFVLAQRLAGRSAHMFANTANLR
jgi:hypothetical protein